MVACLTCWIGRGGGGTTSILALGISARFIKRNKLGGEGRIADWKSGRQEQDRERRLNCLQGVGGGKVNGLYLAILTDQICHATTLSDTVRES